MEHIKRREAEIKIEGLYHILRKKAHCVYAKFRLLMKF